MWMTTWCHVRIITLVKDVCKMMTARGYNLNKWISKSWKLFSQVKESDRSKAIFEFEPGDVL